jgi:arginase
MRFSLITMPYSTELDQGAAAGPDALLRAGFLDWLLAEGHAVSGPYPAALTPEVQAAYGTWNRIGLANGHLARLVSEAVRAGAFPLVLESNCYGALGVLGGLQIAREQPPRLGMVWIDAHGDCNTPETTLSGMLSGMPVAIATGLCLERLRKQTRLDPPISSRNVVMVCVRANDPLEQELIDQSGMDIVPTADLKNGCRELRAALERLSGRVDQIYVHFDVDALDAAEVPSMWISAPGGPTTAELAAALKIIMAAPKIAALGVADINPERDTEGQMVQAALAVMKGAIAGLAG